MKTKLCLTGVVLTLLAVTQACAPSGEPGATTLKRIQAEKVVRIGYANEAPYAYQDKETGEVTGEAPEIARVVLAQLGVDRVEGVLTEFGSLIPGLKAGRFDIIAAGMYVLPERCKEIAFSDPSYCVGEAFAVQAGNPKNLHSYTDIAANREATIGVMAGAVERSYARATGIPDDRIIVFPDYPSALAGVKAGRVDVLAGTSLTVQDLVDKDTSGKVERADPFTNPVIDGNAVRGCGAFGFRKQDTALRDAFNTALREFVGTPAHQEIVRPFGFTEHELPQGLTAEELCQGQ